MDNEPGTTSRPDFAGRVGRTVGESTPWWPRPGREGRRPNVVVIVLDDVGFAQLGCYGSSIATPRMDALADAGLRYTNFHVTALCSPTRASLLTGRNHHSVGMGFLAAFDTGFPNYRGAVTQHAATLGELLRDAGYGTYASGKWHLTPPTQMSPAGPFDQWPTQRGFDRYYGFLLGEDDQYAPELWYDQHRVEVPDDPEYHLSADLVAHGTQFVADHVTSRPDDPFLLYLAFGACHAPHQAPRRYVDRYRGAFDHGWDAERERVLARQVELGVVPEGTTLAPRNPGVQEWASLSPDQRRLYARMQEVFAGFMTHTDDQVGILVDFLAAYGLLDDTVIMLLSDNGASGEGGENGLVNEYRYFMGMGGSTLDEGLAAIDELGGPGAHNHYPAGWAQAGNTPLRFYKKHTYGGGVRAPLIVHWPRGIDTGDRLRGQFHHVVDVLPTLVELAGAKVPDTYRGYEQIPLHGTSMAYSFDRPETPSTRDTQYFETAGYRGLYRDGWKVVTSHEPGTPFDDDHWGLYRLDEDFSECHDRSGDHPQVAAELREAWWREAERYGVLPLDDRMGTRVTGLDPARDRLTYRFLPGTRIMNSTVGPNFSGRSFRVTARLEPGCAADADGVLLAYGRRAHGFSFFVLDGRPVLDWNMAGDHTLVRSARPAPDGCTELSLLVQDRPDGVTAQLAADKQVLAEQSLPRLLPGGLGPLAAQCGYNSPSAVSDRYQVPFRYQGRLFEVVVELQPRTVDASDADWLAEMVQQ